MSTYMFFNFIKNNLKLPNLEKCNKKKEKDH